jgi:hypothetical protein
MTTTKVYALEFKMGPNRTWEQEYDDDEFTSLRAVREAKKFAEQDRDNDARSDFEIDNIFSGKDLFIRLSPNCTAKQFENAVARLTEFGEKLVIQNEILPTFVPPEWPKFRIVKKTVTREEKTEVVE